MITTYNNGSQTQETHESLDEMLGSLAEKDWDNVREIRILPTKSKKQKAKERSRRNMANASRRRNRQRH